MPFKIAFLLIVVLCAFNSASDVQSARAYFLKAGTDAVYADKLKTLTEGRSEALLKAYHGTAWAMKAKHHGNPVKKLEFLNKGLSDINTAVLLNAADIEIRFLRFSVEDNIPSVVPFKSHIAADKKMLIENTHSGHPFYSTIKGYLLQSGRLSASEKASLR